MATKKKKITWEEMEKAFWDYNREHDNGESGEPIAGVVVYKKENWGKPYSVKSRSYKVYSSNRAFQSGKISNSIFGYCLDGTDDGVRLDWYRWDVDYCYML